LTTTSLPLVRTHPNFGGTLAEYRTQRRPRPWASAASQTSATWSPNATSSPLYVLSSLIRPRRTAEPAELPAAREDQGSVQQGAHQQDEAWRVARQHGARRHLRRRGRGGGARQRSAERVCRRRLEWVRVQSLATLYEFDLIHVDVQPAPRDHPWRTMKNPLGKHSAPIHST
jgi:hypothetical protein